jgi:hypothetical protein
LDAVLTAIAIIPSAPVLVPELAGGAAVELADLRQAVGAAASSLPERWVAIGVGAREAEIGPSASGSFGGYGVDVDVGLSSATSEVAELPLCALIAGWVRGQVRPAARAEVRVFGADLSADLACARGKALRAEIDQASDQVGVLVVADGAHTLTPPAPGGYDPDSVDVQTALDDALADGDTAALLRLPPSIPGRVAWQVLAGLARPRPRSAKELYRGAPFGVGYFAGLWVP